MVCNVNVRIDTDPLCVSVCVFYFIFYFFCKDKVTV